MYKIIQDNKVVDVVRIPRFISFLSSGHIALTDKTSATGIVGSDDKTLYSFKPIAKEGVLVASIKEVTIEEFNRLQSLLNSNQEISADENALAKAKQEIIAKLSSVCKNKIIAGFSIILSDDKEYNFKLTTEDQLNLMSIEGQLNAGASTFIYHATNQPCKFFSREDMVKIINAFKRHTLYHTTYFNAAKQYINSLVDIEKVNMFTYGTDVSEAIEDIVIKQILKNGGNL
jgi:hypothetical protein